MLSTFIDMSVLDYADVARLALITVTYSISTSTDLTRPSTNVFHLVARAVSSANAVTKTKAATSSRVLRGSKAAARMVGGRCVLISC